MSTISVDNGTTIDHFGRTDLARRLLDTALQLDAAESGAVIGLEGRWGSGKTYVLRQLERVAGEAEFDGRLLLVRFNPWMLSGASDIVSALLLQLSAAISAEDGSASATIDAERQVRAAVRKGAGVAESIRQYASLLKVLKGVGWLSEIVFPTSGIFLAGLAEAGGAMSSAAQTMQESLRNLAGEPPKLSLHDVRDRVVGGLRDRTNRIVIVVDDLDRLPPPELGEMIRAIKAVADFPNVVYLLLYDPATVATALQAALGVNDGRAYLEKIVHLPIAMPAIPAGTFRAFTAHRIEAVFERFELPAGESADLRTAIPFVAAMLATPRDVERLRTRLIYLCGILRTQVNLADVLVLEAVAMCSPGVVKWITENLEILTEPDSDRYHSDLLARGIFQPEMLTLIRRGKATPEQIKDALDGWKKHVPEQRKSEQDAIGKALRFVFDPLAPGQRPAERSNYRRGQVFRYFYRWQCGAQSHDLFSTADIEDLLRAPESLATTRAFEDEDTFRDFCVHLFDLHEDSISAVNVEGLAVAFSAAEERFGTHVVANRGEIFGPFRTLMKLLDRADAGAAINSLKTLVDRGSVWLSGGALVQKWTDEASARRNGMHSNVTQEELQQIVDAWLAKVTKTVGANAWAPPRPEYSVYSLLSLARLMDCDAAALLGLMKAALFEQELGLDACFGNFAGESIGRRWDIDWPILPPASDLLPLLELDKAFVETHSEFVAALVAKAHEESAPEGSATPDLGSADSAP